MRVDKLSVCVLTCVALAEVAAAVLTLYVLATAGDTAAA
jgi:hypothetical protein